VLYIGNYNAGDYVGIFVPKFVNIEPKLLELFKPVAGVRFLDTVYFSLVFMSIIQYVNLLFMSWCVKLQDVS